MVPAVGARSALRGVRFGFTVPKRLARRAVQRALVKRVLREAARHAATTLEARSPAGGLDVVLRLKAALPAASALPLAQLKRQLREEADSLLRQYGGHLAGAVQGS